MWKFENGCNHSLRLKEFQSETAQASGQVTFLDTFVAKFVKRR